MSTSNPWASPLTEPGSDGADFSDGAYQMSDKAVTAVVRRGMVRQGAFYGAIMAGSTTVSLFGETVSLVALGISLVPMVAIFGFAVVQIASKTRARLESYVLTVEPGALFRKVDAVPDLRIGRGDVDRIERNPHGDLLVRTTDELLYIDIPKGLNGFTEVEAALSQWQTIQDLSRSRLIAKRAALMVVVGGSLLTTWYGDEPSLVIGAGLIYLGIAAYNANKLRVTKNTDKRLRYNLLITAAFAMTVIYRIMTV